MVVERQRSHLGVFFQIATGLTWKDLVWKLVRRPKRRTDITTGIERDAIKISTTTGSRLHEEGREKKGKEKGRACRESRMEGWRVVVRIAAAFFGSFWRRFRRNARDLSAAKNSSADRQRFKGCNETIRVWVVTDSMVF